MKTAKGLVQYVEKALKEKWGYVLGTYGQILTPSLLKSKQSQGYGVGTYNTKHKAYQSKYINKMVSDCYGLVKGYVWPKDSRGSAQYVASQDRNQEGAYKAAKEKGPLNTMPEIPGLVLWMKGHAGVYVGNGYFIECVGSPVGMRKGRISNGRVVSGSKFTHWFKDTYIKYDTTTTTTASRNYMIRGDNGNEVLSLQNSLAMLNYDLDVDGNYGPATEREVTKYQKDKKLKVDGSAGAEVLAQIKKDMNDPTIPKYLKRGVTTKSVTTIQEALKEIGYSINVSNIYDEATVRAVTRFQEDYSLSKTGVADPSTRSKILKVLEDKRSPEEVAGDIPNPPAVIEEKLYSVVVADFINKGEADKLVKDLQGKNINSYVVKKIKEIIK